MIKESRWILIYVSYGSEVSTLKLIDYFWKKNKIVAVPKVENGEINFYISKGLKVPKRCKTCIKDGKY